MRIFSYLCIMEEIKNSVLIQETTLTDIERMINRAVDARMSEFYERINQKPRVMVKRKDAARMLGVSLPTLDAYAKIGMLHAKHVGGRVFYSDEELLRFRHSIK